MKIRIRAVIIILVVVGVFVGANLLIDDRAMTRSRFESTTAVCLGCHGAVPEYDDLQDLHNKKTAFDCSRCHADIAALKTTDNIHEGVKWLGAGLGLLVLTGITTSLVIVSRGNGAE